MLLLRAGVGVSHTRIFARATEGGRQALAYEMNVTIERPVAMVLPLPVPAGSSPDAVRFIDMSECEAFFGRIDRLFTPFGDAARDILYRGAGPRSLAVHRVGRFEASFVPAREDFARLDPRFRMHEGFWKAAPDYDDWGFAVFQLAPAADGGREAVSSGNPAARRVHPMAFEFPRRHRGALFFPTLHVHDGEVHPVARFDHRLYWQLPRSDGARSYGRLGEVAATWERAPIAGEARFSIGADAGLFDGALDCYRAQIVGDHPNQDVWIAADGSA